MPNIVLFACRMPQFMSEFKKLDPDILLNMPVKYSLLNQKHKRMIRYFLLCLKHRNFLNIKFLKIHLTQLVIRDLYKTKI